MGVRAVRVVNAPRIQATPWLFQRILWSAVTALMVVGLPTALLVVGLGWAV